MTPDVIHPLERSVATLVAMLAAAIVVAIIAQRLRIPYTVALVVAGLAVSLNSQAEPFAFGPSLLFLFLPALLFEAAWSLNAVELARNWAPIAWLAVPGVLFTLAIAAAGVALGAFLPWGAALVFGAIVSATDPVVLIALFRELRAAPALATIVEGESIANDGVATVLATTFVGIAIGTQVFSPFVFAISILAQAAFATAIGIGCAVLVGFLLGRTRETELWTVGTILIAYGAYVLADAAHASGIFATIAAGIAFRRLFGARVPRRQEVADFWGVVAFLANSLVFLLMGLTLHVDRLIREPRLIFVALGAIVVSRLILAYTLPPFRALAEGGWRWRAVIGAAGIRGGLALALALGLPSAVPDRELIVDAVFGVVLITVVIQGLAIGPLVRRLGLTAAA